MPRARSLQWFKRAGRGLYGNRMIQFGNKVSFAENKSRRTWKPNVQKTTFFSDTLQERLQCNVTTHTMRCIRKAGGFDQYLIKTADSEIRMPRALRLKERIIAARKDAYQARKNTGKAVYTGSDDGGKGFGAVPLPDVGQSGNGTTSDSRNGLHSTPPAKFPCCGLADIL